MTIKKRIIVVQVLWALLFSITPTWAIEGSNIITLGEAKELALINARTMQNLGLTQEKLKVDAKIAYDQYFGTDVKNNIDGYNSQLKQLQSKLSDPATDPAEIPGINARIAQIEVVVSGLKAALPASEEPSNMLRKQWRATNYAYEDMDKTIRDAEKILEFNVEKMYFGLLDMERTIALNTKNLDLLGIQLKIERLKRELGYSTELDEKNIALQYDLLYKTLESLKNNRQIIVWQMNDLLGRDAKSELILQAEPITPQPFKYNYEELLSKTLENSLQVVQKEREIRDYATDVRKESNSNRRSSLLVSQDIAELELVDLKESIKTSVKALLDEMDASYKTWENKALEKNKAEITFRNDKIKHELGMISELQYLFSEASYLKASYDELTAAQAWYIAKHKADLSAEGIVLQ